MLAITRMGSKMKNIYVIIRHDAGYDYNIAAYENIQTAIARMEKEKMSQKDWSFSFWIDTIVLNEE